MMPCGNRLHLLSPGLYQVAQRRHSGDHCTRADRHLDFKDNGSTPWFPDTLVARRVPPTPLVRVLGGSRTGAGLGSCEELVHDLGAGSASRSALRGRSRIPAVFAFL